MATEIERKFLVNKALWENEIKQEKKALVQGYLLSHPDKTIRVRTNGSQAFITIKGKAAENTIGRPEYEYEIPLDEGQELIEQFAESIVSKTRYYQQYQGKLWEIDQFEEKNAGLIVAEIELDSEDEIFEKPAWVAEEVTHDPKYLNANLAKHPFKEW